MMRWQEWVWIHTRPPLDRLRDERGFCNVCGENARFLFNRWAMPAKLTRDFRTTRVRDAYRRRESMWCSVCGASTRERGLWAVLLKHYGERARSAKELVAEDSFSSLRICELNRLNAGHQYLSMAPGLTYTEYPEEDIQALSYADETFDLLITSDTLEHVPDFRLGLRETRRVLRAGGRHILTVPLRPDLPVSQDRQEMDPIYHGMAPGPLSFLRPPTEDMVARHDFALDFVDEVREAGFAVELHGTSVESVICATAG